MTEIEFLSELLVKFCEKISLCHLFRLKPVTFIKIDCGRQKRLTMRGTNESIILTFTQICLLEFATRMLLL